MVETNTLAKLKNTIKNNAVKITTTFALSVCTILLLGKSLSEIAAEKILEIQTLRPSNENRENARNSASRLLFRNADSAEYAYLIDIFGGQLNNTLGEISYYNQPFKITTLTYDNVQKHNQIYVVLWPRICNQTGCRFDFVDFSSPRLLGSIFGVNVRSSDEFLDGKRIFIDTDGALIYWKGDGYVREIHG